MLRALTDWRNWRVAARAPGVLRSPSRFVLGLIRGGGDGPVSLRSPIGAVTIRPRNRETLKTVFSVFVRGDYAQPAGPAIWLDCGANVGVASVYFLSRHREVRVYAYEPDPQNWPVLTANLAPFGPRAQAFARAVSADGRPLDFAPSADGKYSGAAAVVGRPGTAMVESVAIGAALAEVAARHPGARICLKVDVEGMEREILGALRPEDWARLDRVVVEGTGFADLAPPGTSVRQVSGYVEHLTLPQRD